jgi:hypothetical protein
MSQQNNFERGPQGLRSLGSADGAPEVDPQVFDTGILKDIIPRQWKTAPFAEPVLALEIIGGPYVGVIFGFSSFMIIPQKLEDGLVPARFETTIYKSPKGFDKDEAFDYYCRELLLAWLHFIATSELGTVLKSEPVKGLH